MKPEVFWAAAAAILGLIVLWLTWLGPRRQLLRDNRLKLFKMLVGLENANYATDLLATTGQDLESIATFCGGPIRTRTRQLVETWNRLADIERLDPELRLKARDEFYDLRRDSRTQIGEIRDLVEKRLNNWWWW